MVPQDLTSIYMIVCEKCGKREIGYKKSFVYDLEKQGWITQSSNGNRVIYCNDCKLEIKYE